MYLLRFYLFRFKNLLTYFVLLTDENKSMAFKTKNHYFHLFTLVIIRSVFPALLTLAPSKLRNVFCPAQIPRLTTRRGRNCVLNQRVRPATASARRDTSAWRWPAGGKLSTSEWTSTRILCWPTTTVWTVVTVRRFTTWPAPGHATRKHLTLTEQTLRSSR